MEFSNVVFNAARDGKLRRLKVFLEDRPQEVVQDLLSSCSNGATPLVIAAKNGHLEVIDYILTKSYEEALVEQVGNVEFDGETIEGAPPLWCAAAAGHYKVVRSLIGHGARVNSTTKTKSTPLRAACYDGHLKIVSYLVEAGADVEIANRHGHTCLMIACYKNRFGIAKYLIQAGADINRKSVKGNTALHDCAEAGSLEIMELLLAKGAKMEMDSYGLTPLMAAALTGHSSIVELILSLDICTRRETIDALELLGATYVDKKRDMMGALDLWRRAMHGRFDNDLGDRTVEPLEKVNISEPVEAYDNATEALTLEQLDELFSDPDQMRMQALLVRERILGPAHPDTSYYIRFRGAVYADTGNFERCILLWTHALDMQQKHLEPLNPMSQSSLLSFVELFSFMMSKEEAAAVRFVDLFAVFQRALLDLQTAFLGSAGGHWSEIERTNLHQTLVILLHFVGLLCRLHRTLNPDEELELRRAVYRLVNLDPRGKNNWSLLHLACYRDSSRQSIRVPLCEFPMASVVQLLLELGARTDQLDGERNTPLHIVAANKQSSAGLTFELLLKHGAHLDSTNGRGETPLRLLATHGSFAKKLKPLRFITLQCLCARAIVERGLEFEQCLSAELKEFVQRH